MILLIDNYASFTSISIRQSDSCMKILLSYAMTNLPLNKYKTCSRKQLSSLPAPVTQKMQASLLPLSRNSAEPFQF